VASQSGLFVGMWELCLQALQINPIRRQAKLWIFCCTNSTLNPSGAGYKKLGGFDPNSRDLHTSCLQRREYLTNLPLSLVKWGLSSSELPTCVLASADYSRLLPGWIIISISAWESTCQFVKGCCRNAHRFPALQYAEFFVALGSSRR
jgi:hypothetical protein